MRLLVLGGTVFMGRHLVESAMAAGHEVTLFNRGVHNADLFPEAEHLRGDRDGGLDPLQDRTWDVVVDTSGYVPRIVSASARLLAASVERYVFISSMSVYADTSQVGMDEATPLATLDDETVEEVTGETYGPLKALSEAAVEAALPGRATIIRPGLIVGPHDQSDRFTYWPHRIAEGGEVLVPGHPEKPVQFIDVRDLASWTLRVAEEGTTGAFNAVGPDYSLTMGHVIETCAEGSAGNVSCTWVDEKFLLDIGVAPWIELPLWIPEDEGMQGFMTADCSHAMAAGLRFRPVAETIRDTLAWASNRPVDYKWRAGLTREREREVLEQWQRSWGAC